MKNSLWAVLAMMILAMPASANDQIRIATSSTVFPFAAAVAEQFGKTSGFKTPVIESIGSGGALKLFCASAADGSPDIAGASRRITASEIGTCVANGVTDITEFTIGYDGIVLAHAVPRGIAELTRRELFLALAKTVPVGGRLVPNPYTQWNQINPALPADDILVYGPALNHGTRDILGELALSAGCRDFPEIAALDAKRRKAVCQAVREDGRFVEVTADYTVILRKLVDEKRALGFLPFSYLDQNGDKVKAVVLEGQSPSYDAIFQGNYPLSRPLFVYVKKAHLGLTAGLRAFLAELTSDRAAGPAGYLANRGLIALSEAKRKDEAEKVGTLPNIQF